MLLSDVDIIDLQRNQEVISEGWNASHVQPASYELTLGTGEALCVAPDVSLLDISGTSVKQDMSSFYYHRGKTGTPGVVLPPGDFLLVSTAERVCLPPSVAARVEGKSSLGRLGLAIHTTAGWIDPGFNGNITLELYNCSPRTWLIPYGNKIAQLAFFPLFSPALHPYGSERLNSAYQGQSGVAGSKGTR